MTYRAIGLMSGSSLDGVDLVFASFESKGPEWNYSILANECVPYNTEWKKRLSEASQLSAFDYLQLHADYGKYLGQLVKAFMESYGLDYKVQLIAVHGHTVFHEPQKGFTHQLGAGATIAAITGIPVITNLRSMDIAFGGQGAPLVPLGEKKLFSGHRFFLNIGGIANISVHTDKVIGFDVCPANRILNLLAEKTGKEYDDKGEMAKSGKINHTLLTELNTLPYYLQPYPKSLSNQFGLDIITPILAKYSDSIPDLLCTYTEHIAIQIHHALHPFSQSPEPSMAQLMITGGGAYNDYLIERISHHLPSVKIHLPEKEVIQYKEALIMAFLGILRWREEPTVLSSVTGASAESIGGAIWSGHI
ncbi:MAG: anhydro-N-acetylmuramic acid kinase [Bacteroidota bacterium]